MDEITDKKITNRKESAEAIKRIVENMISKMGVEGTVEATENANELKIAVRTKEGGVLIGENGRNLFALGHIVKRMAEQVLPEKEKFSFSLDVNDYQAKRIEELKAIARISAQRVRYFKKAVLMKPMQAFERKIIHTALMEYPDIITESVGEEPKRQVMIKPYI